jgi:hypothetical protein
LLDLQIDVLKGVHGCAVRRAEGLVHVLDADDGWQSEFSSKDLSPNLIRAISDKVFEKPRRARHRLAPTQVYRVQYLELIQQA